MGHPLKGRRKIMSIVFILLSLYLAVVIFIYLNQRAMLYYPDTRMGLPEDYGLEEFNPLTLTTDDGVKITAWYHPQAEGYPLIIYFHGNGGHLGYRHGIYKALADAGFGVLAVSYRGYGGSEGSPQERGLYRDGRAAFAHATDTLGFSPSRILLYGESLGTAVAATLALENAKMGHPIGGLILQAPFTSILARAQEIYFFLPVRALLRDRYETIQLIGRVNTPVLVLHGEADTIVPPHHGRALLQAAVEPKRGVFFPGVGHNDFPVDAIMRELMKFVAEHALLRPDHSPAAVPTTQEPQTEAQEPGAGQKSPISDNSDH